MKVLLVSEGKHESGGAAEALVRRLNDQVVDVEQDRLSRNSLRAVFGKGRGYYKRAVRWILEARRRGFDAIVLIADHDGRDETRTEFDKAQHEPSIRFSRALGVAVRTFDAWMLADEQALTKSLGFVVPRQPDPESDQNPKHCCETLLSQSKVEMSQTQMYSIVANAVDLALLADRCPRGFGPFSSRVRDLDAK